MGLYVDTPQAPDPNATAAAQTNSNVNTAVANSVMGNANENSPTGSVRYTQTGSQRIPDGNGGYVDVPQYTKDTTLSPEQQHLYNQQTQLGGALNNLAIQQTGQLTNTLGTPLSLDGLPGAANSFSAGGPIQTSVDLNSNAPTTFGQTAGNIQYGVGPNDFSQDRDKVESAIYSRLQPQQDRDRQALYSRLANQGITQGSEAWNRATDELDRSNTDARMQAILAGGQEQSRLYNLALSQGQFNNSAQQQDYTQQQGRGLFAQQGIAQNNAALLDEGQFANNAQQQQFGQNQAQATFANDARARALQEQLTVRNQPINEIGALMSGGQVSMPQFQAFQGGQVAGTPIGQYITQGYQTQAQQAAADNSAIAGMFGSIGGGLTRGLFSGGKIG